jgi:hypothetical protein
MPNAFRYSFGVFWWLTAMCFFSVVNPLPQTRQTTLSAPNALFTGTAGFNSPETSAPSPPSDPARLSNFWNTDCNSSRSSSFPISFTEACADTMSVVSSNSAFLSMIPSRDFCINAVILCK